jgi:hypothetical protein
MFISYLPVFQSLISLPVVKEIGFTEWLANLILVPFLVASTTKSETNMIDFD